MRLWKCKNGTMIEMIFNEHGDFVKFGDNVSKRDAEKAKKEIFI